MNQSRGADVPSASVKTCRAGTHSPCDGDSVGGRRDVSPTPPAALLPVPFGIIPFPCWLPFSAQRSGCLKVLFAGEHTRPACRGWRPADTIFRRGRRKPHPRRVCSLEGCAPNTHFDAFALDIKALLTLSQFPNVTMMRPFRASEFVLRQIVFVRPLRLFIKTTSPAIEKTMVVYNALRVRAFPTLTKPPSILKDSTAVETLKAK